MVTTEEAIQKITDQRKRFARDAGPDENLGGYLNGLEDALRILRGGEPQWEVDPFDEDEANDDPWTDDLSE